MMSQSAIYELAAVILALPLSYALAFLLKKWAYKFTAYQNEIDRLFVTYWNGRPEDEYNAWLKVRRTMQNASPSEKQMKYVDKNLRKVNRNNYISGSYIGDDGEIRINENAPVIRIENDYSQD